MSHAYVTRKPNPKNNSIRSDEKYQGAAHQNIQSEDRRLPVLGDHRRHLDHGQTKQGYLACSQSHCAMGKQAEHKPHFAV